jgi:hypothetical protein
MTATGRSLRSSASTTSLPPRLPSSTSNIVVDAELRSERPVAVISHPFQVISTCPPSLGWPPRHSKQEPSLAELIRAEQDWDNAAAPTRSHAIEAALVEEGKRGGRLVVDAELRSERPVAVISHPFQVISTPSQSSSAPSKTGTTPPHRLALMLSKQHHSQPM